MSDTLHVVCPHCDGANRIPVARLGDRPKCGRCKAPLFTGDPVALDEARFVKVDVDANPGLAQRFGVRGIPALFAIVGGKVAAQQAGLSDAGVFREWVDRFTPVQV